MTRLLTILAPAFYPSRDRVRYFLDSAARWGLEPTLYGLGEVFTGWEVTHITRLAAELARVRTPMVLMTDACDALFGADEQTLSDGWDALGRPPIVMGVEEDNKVNGGGWFAETQALIDALGIVTRETTGGDPQVRWREAIDRGLVDVRPDYEKYIFWVSTRGVVPQILTPVMHFPGGYSDPETGRDYRMGPIFEGLYG